MAETETQAAAARTISNRLVSLDAFRGATMALMVLVNTPGDGANVYAPLRHKVWNGWTITDVVFPSFLWIVGVAITLALRSRLERGVKRSVLIWQIVRRSAVIFALGLLIYLFPYFEFSTMRICGVLQRIAVCYLLASLIYLWTPRLRSLVIWIVGLLAAYWMLMTLVPVPGFGAGRLDVEGNLAHYVDRIVFGVHNYAWTKTWDPEGLVSTLPAIATALFGVAAGEFLRRPLALTGRLTQMFVAGNALLALGLICDIWLPINKSIWTSSFAIFMAGLDFVLLSIFIYFVDHLGYKRWCRPFVILGMNAITVYMISELLPGVFDAVRWNTGQGVITLQTWLYKTCFAPLAAPINASLIYAVTYTLLMFLCAWLLYRKGWFLRV